MSGSGKGLLGLWLYRTGEEWALKDGPPRSAPAQVRIWACFETCQRVAVPHTREYEEYFLSRAVWKVTCDGPNVRVTLQDT